MQSYGSVPSRNLAVKAKAPAPGLIERALAEKTKPTQPIRSKTK